VIAEPPFCAGADHDKRTARSIAVALSDCGEVGTPITAEADDDAVALSDCGEVGTPITAEADDDASLVPPLVTARTRNRYVVPLLSPVTVAEVATETPSLNCDHVA